MSFHRANLADPPASLLNYAPMAKPGRWRRLGRVLLSLAMAGVVLVLYRHGPDALRKAAFLYHQQGCLRYTAASDEVVFDSNPTRVAALARDPNFVISGGCAFRKPPADWVAVRSSLAITITSLFPAVRSPTVLFLHERVVNGVPRLVAVERNAAAGESPYFIPGYDIESCAIGPATLRIPAQENRSGDAIIDVLDSIGPHTDIRIYAGQPDPTDDSRFTIRYEFQGKSRIVEGRVAADGSVDFHRLGE